MTGTMDRWLRWTPRALGLAFALFLGVFALDVFDGQHGFVQTLVALGMHLLPTLLVLATIALAWRWPWLGALVCLGLAAWHIGPGPRHLSLDSYLIIDGPLVLMALLFGLDALRRGRHRPARA